MSVATELLARSLDLLRERSGQLRLLHRYGAHQEAIADIFRFQGEDDFIRREVGVGLKVAASELKKQMNTNEVRLQIHGAIHTTEAIQSTVAMGLRRALLDDEVRFKERAPRLSEPLETAVLEISGAVGRGVVQLRGKSIPAKKLILSNTTQKALLK